ncbi:MAG: bifunctional DNA-formamidopyrimidine glycosylase/DNA-(apurinic or apyrimidinic site) lyase [Planctomycetes bacterium]|nr:bifunctional DNA-formamidopyrimidine glycosylase/DNA-(apurinic or apyrimidinic site) lyase [Planctomycetota bacterium]
MPELPEVETMRRGIAAVRGARVAEVVRPRSRLRPMTIEPAGPRLRARLRGAAITDVDRVGKRVVIGLDTGERLVFEPRMTGLVLLRDPPTDEHVRLRLALEGAAWPELIFWDRRGLGTVRLLDEAAFRAACGPPRLGPDALGLPAEALRARLEGRRRPIKVALLDQAALAGVGNIYAAEALHRAGLHPARPCDGIAPAEWAALHRALQGVLEEAIRARGSTLSDRTYRTAESAEGGFQASHRVYARAGQPCRGCGAAVVRIVQAQRSTFFCPGCQR